MSLQVYYERKILDEWLFSEESGVRRGEVIELNLKTNNQMTEEQSSLD
jgi:hypothetical protein